MLGFEVVRIFAPIPVPVVWVCIILCEVFRIYVTMRFSPRDLTVAVVIPNFELSNEAMREYNVFNFLND